MTLKNTPDIVSKSKIIHIDMDAFYASVEQRDNPDLSDQPVIVGGLPGQRGVVAACSYEARKFGIHSAMPSSRARRLCPAAVFIRPRFDVYRQVSQDIRAIFREYTELVEPLSLDEAYLDVTDEKHCEGSATLMAREIKQRILDTTGLTASAGVSCNKFLAKVASDMDKPDGLYVITPEKAEVFIAHLPIRKFFGIGCATEYRMKDFGINTGADLRQQSEEALVRHFGKAGHYYYAIARGIDRRRVNPHRIRKSLGSETTLQNDVSDLSVIKTCLEQLSVKVADSLKAKGLAVRTITLKVKYADFELITRSHTRDDATNNAQAIRDTVIQLSGRTEAGRRPIRLLGVTGSNFSEAVTLENGVQLNMF